MAIDLFTLPHKALRAYFGRTAAALGSLDIDDETLVKAAQLDLHQLVDTLEAHGHHEDEFILPLLDRHLPDVGSRQRADHAELTSSLDDLRRQVDAFAAAPAAGAHLSLYRHLRRTEAANQAHLDHEETSVMPALWVVSPEAELLGVMEAFKAAHPEAAELYRRVPEALSPTERQLVGL